MKPVPLWCLIILIQNNEKLIWVSPQGFHHVTITVMTSFISFLCILTTTRFCSSFLLILFTWIFFGQYSKTGPKLDYMKPPSNGSEVWCSVSSTPSHLLGHTATQWLDWYLTGARVHLANVNRIINPVKDIQEVIWLGNHWWEQDTLVMNKYLIRICYL